MRHLTRRQGVSPGMRRALIACLTACGLASACSFDVAAHGKSAPAPSTRTAPASPRALGLGGPLVRVNPQGRYLETPDGKPLFVVGHAEAFGFFFQPMNPKNVQAAFLKEMRARGENTIVVQVENENLDFFGGHKLNLEHPVGVYNEAIARQFDEFLTLAEKEGIYVITYLWDTFNMDFNWEKSPYNVVNGGPCRHVSDMLTNRDAIALQKKKFKWAIERWGNRKNLLAWDLMNEIEWAVAGKVPANRTLPGIYQTASAEQMRAWVEEMGAFVRKTELETWGYARLRTVSTNESKDAPPWLVDHPEVDFVSSHFYSGDWDAVNQADYPVKAALSVWKDVGQWLGQKGTPKPYVQTEHGPLSWHLKRPNEPYPHDEAYNHNVTWANWASGAAGSGLRWPYPNFGFRGAPHLNPLSEPMARSLSALRKVSAAVDWKAFKSRQSPDAFRVDDGSAHVLASRDDTQLVAWFLDADGGEGGVQARKLVYKGLHEGLHELTWFDDRSGAVVRKDKFIGKDFTVMSPAFDKHLALVMKAPGPARLAQGEGAAP